jgi:hypothetical protein
MLQLTILQPVFCVLQVSIALQLVVLLALCVPPEDILMYQGKVIVSTALLEGTLQLQVQPLAQIVL